MGKEDGKYLDFSYVQPGSELKAYGVELGDLQRVATRLREIIKQLRKENGDQSAIVFTDGLLQVLNSIITCFTDGRPFTGVQLVAKDELIGLTEAGARLGLDVLLSTEWRGRTYSQLVAHFSDLKAGILGIKK